MRLQKKLELVPDGHCLPAEYCKDPDQTKLLLSQDPYFSIPIQSILTIRNFRDAI